VELTELLCVTKDNFTIQTHNVQSCIFLVIFRMELYSMYETKLEEELFPKNTNESITSYSVIYCEKRPLMSVIKICEDKCYLQRDLSVLDVVMRNVLDSLYLLLFIRRTQWDVLCKVFLMFVQALSSTRWCSKAQALE